jgi:hypothetical protein
VVDDGGEAVIADGHLLGGEAVVVELPWDEVAAGDLALLFFDVAGDLDDFHAVAQGGGDGDRAGWRW